VNSPAFSQACIIELPCSIETGTPSTSSWISAGLEDEVEKDEEATVDGPAGRGRPKIARELAKDTLVLSMSAARRDGPLEYTEP
jgi:hypothetical protein